jgi:D-glycero-alpha-D-manno-heptose-7-phosphate kinase
MGSILDESWHLKRSLSDRISNDVLDSVYATAKKNGALGGKILGAGGTGFFLFYCRPEEQERLRRALGELKETRFRLETEGARLIYDDSGSLEPHPT